MKEQKVFIKNSFDEKLVGLKTVPSNKKDKYPAIVLVHGFGVTKEEGGSLDRLANYLSKSGFLIYRFDFSGCGESEGDYSKTSLTKLKGELEKILDFIKSEKDVDALNIGILAQSFGTPVVVALKPKIKAIILTGSISNPKERMKEGFGKNYNPNGISKKKRSGGNITKVGPQFWKDFNNYNLIKSIKDIKCPILFVYGALDEKLPLNETEAFFKNANEPKKKIIIPEMYHDWHPKEKEVFKLVISWFKKYLKN